MRNVVLILLVLLLVLLLMVAGTYMVDETQQVIITRFREQVGPSITRPGLHFKVPFIQKANYFDKRFLG